MMSDSKTISFCGIDFWNAPIDDLFGHLQAEGGYLIVPSAPSFASMRGDNESYRQAMLTADHAIVDSGLMAATLLLMTGKRVHRISGLRLLQHLLLYKPDDWFSNSKVLWVSPSEEETSRIETYLVQQGLSTDKSFFYEAPMYRTEDDYADAALAQQIRDCNPDLVILCIGGCKQERLAYALREDFGIRVPTLCTGAAIAFLSGGQAKIPTVIDRCCLGWLLRILQDPKAFLPRYFEAAWAFPLFVLNYYVSRLSGAAGRT